MQEIEHKKGKIYYTMGEVAEMFDVNPSLLRYWEQEFDILKPHRNKKGNRLFTTADVDNIRIIYHLLKERKMKIEVARSYIKNHRREVDRDAEITERLMSIRAVLLEIKQDLAYAGDTIYEEEEFSEQGSGFAHPEPAQAEEMLKDLRSKSPHPNEAPRNETESSGEAASTQEAASANAKRPFEEQVLFDIAVPLEMIQAASTGADEGFESAKAAFTGLTATPQEGTEEANPATDAIEQTLF